MCTFVDYLKITHTVFLNAMNVNQYTSYCTVSKQTETLEIFILCAVHYEKILKR